ncbi:MAG: hypothetical protein M9939_24490 [Mesorhizobium sp.]|nr:hypothetical protein [Mesorhizobium sp.]MCO5164253.1 hypothetical protein [Mesorhizobium sp.]
MRKGDEKRSVSGHDFHFTDLWGDHPVRKMEGSAVWLPNQKVADAVMLMLTDHDNGLPSQRMEGIGDDNVEARIHGIMTLLRMRVLNTGRPSPRSLKPPYAALGIRRFMPTAELCRAGAFPPTFFMT